MVTFIFLPWTRISPKMYLLKRPLSTLGNREQFKFTTFQKNLFDSSESIFVFLEITSDPIFYLVMKRSHFKR